LAVRKHWLGGAMFQVRRDQRQVAGIHLNFLLDSLMEEPRLYLVEMVGVIAEKFGVAYNRRQIQRALRNRGWTRKKLERHAREQDLRLRTNFRDVIDRFPPETLVFADETHCDRKTYRRKYGYSARGKPAWKRLFFKKRHRGSPSVSGVANITIQGIMTTTVYDHIVDGDVFLWTLEHDILPMMNAFPGPRSVLIMDNAPVHKKLQIEALAFARGVFIIFLPPYSYDYNPIELAFKDAKAWMQSEFGLEEGDTMLAELLEKGIRNSCSAETACNYFQHCFIGISEELRQWAKDN